MIVATIPARDGSKRIPRKNVVEFNGKLIIAWGNLVAQKSGLFNCIVASIKNTLTVVFK